MENSLNARYSGGGFRVEKTSSVLVTGPGPGPGANGFRLPTLHTQLAMQAPLQRTPAIDRHLQFTAHKGAADPAAVDKCGVSAAPASGYMQQQRSAPPGARDAQQCGHAALHSTFAGTSPASAAHAQTSLPSSGRRYSQPAPPSFPTYLHPSQFQRNTGYKLPQQHMSHDHMNMPPPQSTDSTGAPHGRHTQDQRPTQQDLDVQRILWSQDVDLGVSLNWPEMSPFASKELGTGKDPAKLELDPYLVPTVLPHLPRSASTGFIDCETGEAVPQPAMGSVCATGNGTAHPSGTREALNATAQTLLCRQINGSVANLTALEMDIENRNLQNLIDALNNLNASTLQAIGVQESATQRTAAEDLLQDVQAILERPNENTFGENSFHGFTQPPHLFGGRNLSAVNESGLLNEAGPFNLSSMFIDPPANWSMAMNQPLLQQPTHSKPDVYLYSTAVSNTGTPAQTHPAGTRPRLMTNVNQERVAGSDSGLVSHVTGSSSGGSMLTAPHQQQRPGINHEGPFDFSAFPFGDGEPMLLTDAAAALENLSPGMSSQQVPQLNGFMEHGGLFDFGAGRGSVSMPLLSDSSDFNITSLGDFFPAVNSSGNLLASPLSSVSSNLSNEWKLSQEAAGALSGVNNGSAEVLMLLDEAKMRLMMEEVERQGASEEKQVVPALIKQEPDDVDLDPWTEHANFAARHNHSYARHDRALQSREGSEDMGGGSVGESSGSRRSRGDSLSAEARGLSRPNRDERAATELGLPVTADEVIGMPVEEFNSLVGGQTMPLTQDQIQLMKDIRRRGKNKVAAQNCRRRKIDNMSHLDREIYNLRQELAQATARRDEAARQRQVYRAALAGSASQGATGQRSFSGQDNPSVPLSANAQMDQPNHKRNARDTSSDPLRKRKRGA